ncbi:MAG: MFS transporter [Bacilli bacterium]
MFWRDWDWNIRLRFFGELATGTFSWMLLPFMAIYFAETLGGQAAGVLLVASQFFSVIVGLLGGWLADRYGRRTMIIIGQALGMIGIFIMFAATLDTVNSPVLMFIGYTISGLTRALYGPASQAMIADVVPRAQQGEVFSYFYMAMNVSVTLGPLLGAGLFFTNRLLVLELILIANAALLLVFYVWMKETLPVEKRTTVSGWRSVLGQQLSNYRTILIDRVFALFIVGGIILHMLFGQLSLLISVQINQFENDFSFSIGNLLHITRTPEEMYALLFSENGLIVVFLTTLIVKTLKVFTNRSVFVMTPIVLATGLLAFSFTQSFVGVLLAMFVFTVGEIMSVGVQNEFIASLAPTDMRGQYFAAANLRAQIGKTIAPLSVYISGAASLSTAFYILAIIGVFGSFVYLTMFRAMEKRDIQVAA